MSEVGANDTGPPPPERFNRFPSTTTRITPDDAIDAGASLAADSFAVAFPRSGGVEGVDAGGVDVERWADAAAVVVAAVVGSPVDWEDRGCPVPEVPAAVGVPAAVDVPAGEPRPAAEHPANSTISATATRATSACRRRFGSSVGIDATTRRATHYYAEEIDGYRRAKRRDPDSGAG
ncbi:MAG: hypothetical protein ABEJ28_06345 [Salinigranum sp.]